MPGTCGSVRGYGGETTRAGHHPYWHDDPVNSKTKPEPDECDPCGACGYTGGGREPLPSEKEPPIVRGALDAQAALESDVYVLRETCRKQHDRLNDKAHVEAEFDALGCELRTLKQLHAKRGDRISEEKVRADEAEGRALTAGRRLDEEKARVDELSDEVRRLKNTIEEGHRLSRDWSAKVADLKSQLEAERAEHIAKDAILDKLIDARHHLNEAMELAGKTP